MLFSYQPPEILSATMALTMGGRVTIFGRHFGPIGNESVSAIEVESWQSPSRWITCEDPNVTQTNVALECDMPPGEGGNLNLRMTVGGQVAGPVAVYSYQRPQITLISPSRVSPGTFLTVLGHNFGTSAELIEIDLHNRDGRRLFTLPRDNLTLATPHRQIILPAPMYAGLQLALNVRLPYQALPNTLSSIHNPAWEVFYDYTAPVITSVSRPPTAGGQVTVTGKGFGPQEDDMQLEDDDMRLFRSVLLGFRECSNINVTVNDTELVCDIGAGSGAGYDAFLQVAEQESGFLFGAFSYEAPIILSVEPSLAEGGETLTVMGHNFGDDPRKLSVLLGDEPCMGVVLTCHHMELTCLVPDGVKGTHVGVLVEAHGLRNNVSDSPTFTFATRGCTYKDASNYDPEATRDDGTCVVRGCMHPDAENFDPLANEADGSCRRRPIVVEITFGLSYDDYLLKPDLYNDLVVEDLSSNLGLLDKDRLPVRDVRPGTTLFVLEFLDNETAVGKRNYELVGQLLGIVANNTWSNSAELGPIMRVDVKDGDGGAIRGKAAEPRVSMGSIVGIAVGVALLVFWALCWRFVLRWCARKCCAGSEDQEEVLHGIVQKNQLYKNSSNRVGDLRPVRAAAALPSKTPFGGNQIVPQNAPDD
uniref:Ipt tig domain-containing protein n=1 Tax=Tetraselmis sp. GSL018 TaxID=582737 RepID=A0A061QIR6_9CHLO